MKNVIVFCISITGIMLLAANSILQAQNLVPNPSFEVYNTCPQTTDNLEADCKYWKLFRGTPDYFNNCSAVEGFHNSFGYQKVHTGQAYAGLLEYQFDILFWREQMGVKLITPLVVGSKYYLSFWVSLDYTYSAYNIAINKMGALVTTYLYKDLLCKNALPNKCTIVEDSIITDTNWVEISGSFVADSMYQYLIIGNFFDTNYIDTLHLPYEFVPAGSYYYIDDICLSTDSIYSQKWTGINEITNNKNNNNISVFPNPTYNEIHIKSDASIKLIQIMNSLGQQVYNSEKSDDKELTLSLNFLKPNIYYLKIKTTKGFYNSKINIIY